jgi:hypothetical protein
MEKNGKEPETCKHRSNFVIKVLLVVLCVVVVVLLVVVGKGFASLKDLYNRLNTLEKEKCFDSKAFRSEKHQPGTSRSKRSIDETKFDKAMFRLRKIEER